MVISNRTIKKIVLPLMLGSLLSGNAIAGSPEQPVFLGSAGSFTILSQSGITDVYRSAIVGDVGTSPITGAALLLNCDEVDGTVYTVDAAGPMGDCHQIAAGDLSLAVGAMGAAYTEAAGRTLPDSVERGAGEIGGLTIAPGLHKWSSGVTISENVRLDASGNPGAVWIFQIAGTLTEASYKKVILANGAQARNIFWQVAGAVTLGTYSHFEGILLAKTMIAVNTHATVSGRLMAQTAVTLQMNEITAPSQTYQAPETEAEAEGPMSSCGGMSEDESTEEGPVPPE